MLKKNELFLLLLFLLNICFPAPRSPTLTSILRSATPTSSGAGAERSGPSQAEC